MELARKHENNGCFLNRTEPKETAHIYPNYLIHPRVEDKQALWVLGPVDVTTVKNLVSGSLSDYLIRRQSY